MRNILISQKEIINHQHDQIKTKTIMLCQYCQFAIPKNKLMRCSGKKCGLYICKNCATFVNDKPFCHDCILDIIKHKSLLIVTKGEI